MAFVTDSITLSARPLLRAAGPCAVLTTDEVIALTVDVSDLPIPFVFRPVPPVDDPRTAVELLDEIRREIEGQEVSAAMGENPELPPQPLLGARCKPASMDFSGLAFHGDTPTDTGSADRCSMTSVRRTARQKRHAVVFESFQQLDTFDHAGTLHLRRQLAQAAEHGAALLAALGLPRLVDVDFVPVDREVIGDALDLVISHLDFVDGDTDFEDGHDVEHDTADLEDDATAEPSLGAPERHPYAWTMTDRLYRPAEGKRLMRYRRHESQVSWAQGRSSDVEDDINDQPQDDDEKDDDGLSRGEHDTADYEPPLGSPIGNGDQEHWSQGACHVDEPEEVNEDGDDSGTRPGPRLRPIGPLRPDDIGYDHDHNMRVLSRQAVGLRQRLRPGPARPSPDTVIPIGPGMVWWAGPSL